MTQKFRSKPVTIEAVQYHAPDPKWGKHGNVDEIQEFVGPGKVGPSGNWGDESASPENRYVLQVYDDLHETWVKVFPEQWVIKGTKGEFYPCDPEVFAEKYETVNRAPSAPPRGRRGSWSLATRPSHWGADLPRVCDIAP